MRKLLLLFLTLLFGSLSVQALWAAGQKATTPIRLSADQETIDGKLVARPGATFWVQLDLPKLEDGQHVDLKLDYDADVLSLEKVSDRKFGSDKAAGIQRKKDDVELDLNKMDSSTIYLAFKVNGKGSTEISVEKGSITYGDSSEGELSSGEGLPVITNIEDSSWSRLKAIFNN